MFLSKIAVVIIFNKLLILDINVNNIVIIIEHIVKTIFVFLIIKILNKAPKKYITIYDKNRIIVALKINPSLGINKIFDIIVNINALITQIIGPVIKIIFLLFCTKDKDFP